MKEATLRDVLRDLLFPPRCLLCGRPVPWGSTLCGGCTEKHTVPQTHSLPDAFGCHAVVWAADYKGLLRRGMRRYKFDGMGQGTAFFGEMLVQALRQSGITEGLDAVTYVPMPPRRQRARGYNQAQLLAQYTADALGLPLRQNVLSRAGGATAHSTAGRQQRLALAANSYHEGPERLPEGERILLVDDIITTGATVQQCATLLYRQGAGAVWAAAPLHTPQE